MAVQPQTPTEQPDEAADAPQSAPLLTLNLLPGSPDADMCAGGSCSI